MAKDLVNNPETKLGGAKKPRMDLGAHLEYIESLIEGGAGGELYFDLSPFMETMQLDTEAFEKFQIDITEGKIVGVTLIGTGLFFNYKGIMQNNPEYWFYFSNSTEAVLINSTGAISTGNSLDIPFLPSDASTKNYALNSVNGALTWNTIGNGLEIKNGALQATGSGGGSSKIWYDLTSLSVNSITQEQYDEIKSLIDGNSLAGIKTVLQFFPLVSENNGEFKFAILSKGYEQINSNKKLTLDNIYFTIKSDLSITNNWDTTPVVELTQNLSSQSIPSIKTDGYQQNLTIGDGLTIENGALKTTGSGGGSSILRKDGTYVSKDESVVINTISLTKEEYGKIKNREITTIFGTFYEEHYTFNYKVDFFIDENNNIIYSWAGISDDSSIFDISSYTLMITEESATLFRTKIIQPYIPTLPTDASTKNYTLNSVNGALTWNTIGDGLAIENGALKTTTPTIIFED